MTDPSLPASLPPTTSSTSNRTDTPESTSSDPGKASTSTNTQPVQKRARTSRPKVKTGCSVCKQRRIKCDEKRPACTQCVRAHKDCTGYPPPSRHALPLEGVRIAPRPVLAANLAPGPPSTQGVGSGSGSGPILASKEFVLPPRRVTRRQQHADPMAGRITMPPSDAIAIASTAITSTGNNPSPTTYQPIPGISFSSMEFHYFELFRTQTLSGLSGLFDSASWRQRVLQDCHAVDAIRHAAISLGALFKTLEQSSKTPSPTDANRDRQADAVKSHWQVAVQQYSQACNAIMSPGAQSQQTYHRTRLLVSTLLGTFDAFIGDHKQAIVQIQNGLSLMERLCAEEDDQGWSSTTPSPTASPAPPGPKEPIEDDLAVIFTRLAISAKSYDLAFHFPEPYVIQLTPAKGRPDEIYPKRKSPFSDPVPPGHYFSELRDARLAHEAMLDRGIRFLERLQLAQNHSMGFFPESWKQYGGAYIGEMDAWEAAFRPLFESRLEDPSLNFRQKSSIATLKMEHINCRVLFLSLFSANESGFDAFIPQFATLVELAREVVANDETQAASAAQCSAVPGQCHHQRWDAPSVTAGGFAAYHLKPSFTADLGIVPPLFMVVTKCREPILRRQAIQLLRSSARREGMWDSEMVTHVGHWIMELEEGESSPYQRELHNQQGGGASLRVDTGSGGYPDPFAFDGESYSPFRGGQHNQSSVLGSQSLLHTVPEERRVMIQTIDFDLRSRTADLTVGTRGLKPGSEHDGRRKTTHISW